MSHPSDERSETPPPARPLAPGVLLEPVPLSEALSGIGEVWQLPKKKATVPGGVEVVDGVARGTLPAGTAAVPEPGDALRRTLTSSMAAVADSAPPPAFSAPWRWIAATVAVALFAWASLRAPSYPHDAIPEGMFATWRTTHRDYAFTSLTITDSSVAFFTAPSPPASGNSGGSGGSDNASAAAAPAEQVFRLIGSRAQMDGTRANVTLIYDQDGEATELAVQYVSGGAPQLVFRHPEGLVWYPERIAR